MSDADWIDKLAATLARGVESQLTPDAGIAAIAEIIRQAHAAHLAKLDTSGPQWEQPHYCESCDYEWIPGELDQTCKGCGGHGTLGKRPLDTSGLAERIANGAVPFLITDKGKQELYPMAGIDVGRYAESIAAELAPMLERIAALEEALRGCRGHVAEAITSAEFYANEAESESYASECRAEANLHRGLLSHIDALLKKTAAK